MRIKVVFDGKAIFFVNTGKIVEIPFFAFVTTVRFSTTPDHCTHPLEGLGNTFDLRCVCTRVKQVPRNVVLEDRLLVGIKPVARKLHDRL